MSRFTRRITNKSREPVQVVILAAGASSRTRSYEPRCLLKYNGKTILDHQLTAIERNIPKAETLVVYGVESEKFLKKLDRKVRTVENLRHEITNSGESLRIGFNSSIHRQFLFIHGDLIVDEDFFKKINFDQSFVLVDSGGKMDGKEVGASIVDGKLSLCCYNVPIKWCQIAFFSENETRILERMLWKDGFDTTYLLSYEVINAVIQNGGSFKCIDVGNKFIREIDSLKDLTCENFSGKQSVADGNTNDKS